MDNLSIMLFSVFPPNFRNLSVFIRNTLNIFYDYEDQKGQDILPT